jgi:hypothetical protein
VFRREERAMIIENFLWRTDEMQNEKATRQLGGLFFKGE